MTTQHTPGPWTTGDFDWRTIVGPHTRYKPDRRGLACIAQIDASENPAEDLANALLVRAAPAMLAALKGLLWHAEKAGWHHGYTMAAHQAIGLAEGRPSVGEPGEAPCAGDCGAARGA